MERKTASHEDTVGMFPFELLHRRDLSTGLIFKTTKPDTSFETSRKNLGHLIHGPDFTFVTKPVVSTTFGKQLSLNGANSHVKISLLAEVSTKPDTSFETSRKNLGQLIHNPDITFVTKPVGSTTFREQSSLNGVNGHVKI